MDILSDRVLKLQQQKQEYESRKIIDAYKKSGKTLDGVAYVSGCLKATSGNQVSFSVKNMKNSHLMFQGG